MIRKLKSLLYSLLPSVPAKLHAKRRKGLLYRHVGPEILECQREQDRIFWAVFLGNQRGGSFFEVGEDEVVGSHSLGLEIVMGWKGVLWMGKAKPGCTRQPARSCQIHESTGKSLRRLPAPVDLLAIHQPSKFPELWEKLRARRYQPQWVIVENREPDPQWCHLLEKAGYRLRFYFHDDEYYKRVTAFQE